MPVPFSVVVISLCVLPPRGRVPPGPLAIGGLRQGTLEDTVDSGGAVTSAAVIVAPYPLDEGGRSVGATLKTLHL